MSINGLGAVSTPSIQNMDLETAMMAVQSSRANLLETQLKEQIAAVQAKNELVAKLNTLNSVLNGMVAKFPSNAQAGDTCKNITTAQCDEFNKIVHELNITSESLFGASTYVSSLNKGTLDAGITKLKGQIDNLSNTQQMDMLRLQSLSNKRNEAFDVMTNFIKKMQDNRSAVISNMR